jgi:hypothetical protein
MAGRRDPGVFDRRLAAVSAEFGDQQCPGIADGFVDGQWLELAGQFIGGQSPRGGIWVVAGADQALTTPRRSPPSVTTDTPVSGRRMPGRRSGALFRPRNTDVLAIARRTATTVDRRWCR